MNGIIRILRLVHFVGWLYKGYWLFLSVTLSCICRLYTGGVGVPGNAPIHRPRSAGQCVALCKFEQGGNGHQFIGHSNPTDFHFYYISCSLLGMILFGRIFSQSGNRLDMNG